MYSAEVIAGKIVRFLAKRHPTILGKFVYDATTISWNGVQVVIPHEDDPRSIGGYAWVLSLHRGPSYSLRHASSWQTLAMGETFAEFVLGYFDEFSEYATK
jgi:hypothetical protein